MKLTDYYWFRRIQNAGWCIFHPRPVQSNYPTSRVFDEWMHEALKNPNFSNPVYFAGELFSVELNGVRIWTRNYPYAYGMLYGDAVSIDKNRGALPLSITRSRLFDAIDLQEFFLMKLAMRTELQECLKESDLNNEVKRPMLATAVEDTSKLPYPMFVSVKLDYFKEEHERA